MKLLLLLPLLLVPMTLLSQDALPFTLDNPRHEPFPTELATRIYRYALSNVAREVNPQSPPMITPNFIVHIAPIDKPLLRSTDGAITLTFERWDAAMWSYACAWAASHSILSNARIKDVARWSLSEATATITVDELKRKPQ